MSTNEPGKEIIERLKGEHSDRSLLHIEIDHEGTTYHFLMTGPNAPEYKKFVGEILGAKDKEKEADQNEAVRDATKRGALAQIRWPDRGAVETLFNRFPGMHTHFRTELHNAAAMSAEVRRKKL